MLEKPNSLEAEKGILGTILLDSSKCETVIDYNLTTDHFIVPHHKLLFTELIRMFSEGKAMDAITIYDSLNDNDNLEAIGGSDYLLELQSDTLVPAHSEYYCNILCDKHKLRKEIDVLEESLRIAYEGESVADRVMGRLMGESPLEVKSVDSILDEWKKAKQGIKNTIPTPYPDLDKRTGGIRKGMVTIFTGRSKSGKSMFLAHWYNHLGSLDIPILAVPLEDRYEITIKRMASNYGNYTTNILDAGGRYVNVDGIPKWSEYQDRDYEQGKRALETVSKYPVYFYDKKVTPQELKSIAMKYKRKYNIQAMFVDGAKDLKRPSGKYNDTGFDEEISQCLCEIASQLDIAIISIHHLTKLPDNEMISNNHIRGSGNIVGDSRSVYALQSLAIEGLMKHIGYHCDYDTEGNLTTRLFHCISNNHGTTGLKVLNTNLANCQFLEKTKGN